VALVVTASGLGLGESLLIIL